MDEQNLATTVRSKDLTIPAYERAVSALRECLSFDDVKYWNDLAEAQAAWARINGAKDALRLCRALKLQVARRMGELATILKKGGKPDPSIGRPPGPHSFLVQRGLSKSEAACALQLARMNKYDFDALTSSPHPPAPGNTVAIFRAKPSTAFGHLTQATTQFSNFCAKYPVEKYEEFIYATERPLTEERVTELLDWLTPMTIWCGTFLGKFDRGADSAGAPHGSES